MAKVTSEPKTAAAQSDIPESDDNTTPTTPTDTEQTVTVPDNIVPLFKACPQYDQLWIDREGGVFANKPVDSATAILYKKPTAQKA